MSPAAAARASTTGRALAWSTLAATVACASVTVHRTVAPERAGVWLRPTSAQTRA